MRSPSDGVGAAWGFHVRRSQADPDILFRCVQQDWPFDVIIDDGSHVSEHQRTTFSHSFERGLKPRGYYIIEDLESCIRRQDPLVNGAPFQMVADAIGLLIHTAPKGQSVGHGDSQMENTFLLMKNLMSTIQSIEV